MTSGQPGELTVILALAMTLLSGGAFFISALGRKDLYNLGVRAYKMLIVFASLATIWLFYLFLSHDFSIEYVYNYSSTDLPIYFLFSSFWAGQEGTYLLWFLLSALMGLLILKYGRQYRLWGITFYSLVNLFLGIMLLVASPFKMIDGTPLEGAGLNPLLQDFWMVIHPPMMFVAYAIAAVPFALVLAAIMKKDYSDWLKISFPIVGITSFLLLASNAMGGYWAYKTLGWGGYWAWDPVENTSFVPWIISIALIHGMLIERKTGAFRRVNLLLTMSMFLLVAYGTFLTRSGVLADFSVHSFTDLGTNAVLISFIVSFLLISLGLFFFRRSSEMIGKPFSYNIFSREFVLFAAMFLLSILSAIVMFWSSLPLITQYIIDNPAAAEIATYNSFALPLSILICLFLTLSPILGFGNGSKGKINKPGLAGGIGLAAAVASLLFGKVVMAVAVTIFIYVTVILIYLLYDTTFRRHILVSLIYGLVGAAIAFLLGVRSLANLFFFGAVLTASGAFVSSLFRKIPKSAGKAAAELAHFATGIMLAGILASSYYSTGERIILPRDISASAFDYDFVYHGLSGSVMDANNEIILTMIGEDETMIDARPQYYYSARSDGYMKKPFIKKELLYDYYLAPLDIQEFPDSSRVLLAKNDTAEIAGIKVKFLDFEMLSHGEEGNITIGVLLECEYGDLKTSVKPLFISGPDGMAGQPLKIFEDQPFEVKVEQIFASDGAVVLSFPGTTKAMPVDQLILDVSIKPGINLLWLAVIIICFAMILSIWRRYRWLSA